MSAPSHRIVAVDVLRGATIAGMILVNNPGSWSNVYAPLRHAKWHGWTPTDLVFPFFLFLVGVSIVFALQKRIDAGLPRGDLLKKVGIRTAALFGIGLFLNAFPILTFEPEFGFRDFSTLRIPGVLQRIAICYGITATMFVFWQKRALVIACLACLFVYWALMSWVPVPEHGAGQIDGKGTHLSAYVDMLVFGEAHVWRSAKVYDPEGLLSTIPAVGTTLLGVFVGLELVRKIDPLDKVVRLFVRGALLVLAGYAWSWAFPINKPIWTSSYAVFTAGQATCALALIAYFADVRGYRGWTEPFRIYGVNALTVFVMSGLVAKSMFLIRIGDQSLKGWVYEHVFLSWADGKFASLMFALTWVAGWYVVLRLMYRRGIVIRV